MACPTLLRAFLRYEPESGKLYWKPRARAFFKTDGAYRAWNKRFAGEEACCLVESNGYLSGTVGGRKMLAHRIAYTIYHGASPEIIDHQNGIRADNRIKNLRSVNCSENMKNVVLNANNTSGFCGVYRSYCGKYWYAQIRVDGKKKHLGYFKDYESAVTARRDASTRYGYHQNHGLPMMERV